MSPVPRAVYDAGHAALRQMNEDVRRFALGFPNACELARSAVAHFYGTQPESIAFVGTTSLGMNMLALQVREGEPRKREIVTLRDEFPSSTLPWLRHGFQATFVAAEPDNRYEVGRILDSISPETAAVVVSYVQFGTGARLDVPELARELAARGVWCILNATQAAGVIPVDLSTLPVSAMLVSGNKWMMSGTGSAVMYVSPALRSEGFPSLVGWRSTKEVSFDNKLANLTRAAAGLELGLSSLVPILCMKAAVELIAELGVVNVGERVRELTEYLYGALRDAGADIVTPPAWQDRAGIISIRRADAPTWVASLEEKKVVVVRRGETLVRISPHVYNTVEDLKTLMSLF
ncbi:aminotransferase class V-fold PLP-dependent enzyme [Sorangium sp. So ce269]